jgi:pimeloyl-ACP methyl ester carboxylesterase
MGYFTKDLRFFLIWNYFHKGKVVNWAHDTVHLVHGGSTAHGLWSSLNLDHPRSDLRSRLNERRATPRFNLVCWSLDGRSRSSRCGRWRCDQRRMAAPLAVIFGAHRDGLR